MAFTACMVSLIYINMCLSTMCLHKGDGRASERKLVLVLQREKSYRIYEFLIY